MKGMSTQTEIAFPPLQGRQREPRDAARVKLLVYSADQVCAALQICKITLWRIERRGLLIAIPYLRHKRYSARAVEAFVAASSPLVRELRELIALRQDVSGGACRIRDKKGICAR